MQDTAPRREAEAKPDDGAPPKDAATADNSEGTESEQAQSEKSEISEQPDNAESETAAELPVTETNTVANDQETTPGVTTQTFVDGIPDKNEMLEGAAATPAAGAATDLTGTPEKTAAVTVTLETANAAGETSVNPAAADGDILNAPPAKIVPELAVTQQGTEPQATLSHNAAQNAAQSQIANIVESPASPAINPATNAATVEIAGSSPLATVAAKPVAGARDGSASATTPASTAPTANAGTVASSDAPSASLPFTDAEGEFEAALNNTQNSKTAQSGAGQSSTPGANPPTSSNPETANSAGKAAELFTAADSAPQRIAEAPPPTTASGNNPSPAPVTSANGEVRLVSNASPLAETATRHTPNTAANQVAVQINRAVVDGQDKIEINLKPGNLGRVSVNLEVGHDNRLIAVISAEKPDTLEFLQRDARMLERALQEAGIKTDSGSLSFNLQGQGADDSSSDDFSNDGPFAAVPLSDEDSDTPIANSTNAAYANSASGVDIHV